jgi:hypothetical protein
VFVKVLSVLAQFLPPALIHSILLTCSYAIGVSVFRNARDGVQERVILVEMCVSDILPYCM